MGNVLSASIPSQILPVESYICDISEMEFVQSLGSTRFMKVARAAYTEVPGARAEHSEGSVVLKVFLLHDQSFSIEPYRDQVIRIRELLSTAYNCCPFKKVYLTQRCAIMSRPYQKQTLYDRLSTRPFLANIEKKWIAFQLFKALAQCEAAEVCHGDLKTQNVLVSSSNWVQITDFASFKPSTVPSDDPSYFTFFFDTSRRLSCYLAPERFQPSQELNLYPKLPGEFLDVSKGLTQAMDIFSLGCVLVELFTEGQCPFTYEQLIKFKHASDVDAQRIIQNIQEQMPKEMRRMIGLMLSRNPAKRPQARQLLQRYAPALFPEIFEHFLYNYMNAFRPKSTQLSVSLEEPSPSFVSMESDDVIAKLASDLDMITEKLLEKPQMAGTPMDQTPAALLLISLITSNVRTLRSLAAKLEAMKMLNRLASITEPAIVADRILPYMMYLLCDPLVQVRSEAVYAITIMLSSLEEVPNNETRLFIDYLFPRLKSISLDHSTLVRMSLALNLGTLAETSVRFMQKNSRRLTDDLLGGSIVGEEEDGVQREERLARHELTALHEAVNEIFVNLCGADNNVKHCLVTPKSLEMLCQFFHRQRSSDVLLSHMITFLNDKVDWRLRATFFRCCPCIAHFVGRQSTLILKSLLQQGLHDYEEFVQLRALWCICELCREQLLDRAAVYELLPDAIPFLAHPNEWLRIAVVNILNVLDATLSVADLHCKLMPLVKPYLSENLIKLNNKFVVANCLRPPIPRTLWTYIVDSSPLVALLEYLADKRMFIALEGGPQSIFATSRSQQPSLGQLESCLKRLENLGLSGDFEEKLVKFENVLTKMHDFRQSMGAARVSESPGVIDLGVLPTVKLRKFDLSNGYHKSTEFKMSSNNEMNVEWKELFGDAADGALLTGTLQGDVNDLSRTLPVDQLPSTMISSALSNLAGDHPHRYALRSSACCLQLSELLTHKRERYMRRQSLYPSMYSGDSSSQHSNPATSVFTPSPRVGTKLLVHLHEHRAAVTKLSLSSDGVHFASCSSDGAVKLWSVERIKGDLNSAVRSDATFAYNSKLNGVQFVGHSGESIAIASDDSRVTIVDARQLKLVTTIGFERDHYGPPVQMHAVGDLLYVLTHHGSIFCLDCRMPTNGGLGRKPPALWRHRAEDAYGLITSFCVDPVSQNWMCLTSTNRNLILWDLRFGIEVSNWPHPSKYCRQLNCWPAMPTIGGGRLAGGDGCCSEVWAASSCSGELSRWRLETAQRTHVIWPTSSRPPFEYADDKFVTTAMAICPRTGRIFAGDSLGALRSFSLLDLRECFYLSGPEKRTAEAIGAPSSRHNAIQYDRTVIDTVDVTLEKRVESRMKTVPALSNSPLDAQVTICHRSAVSDLLCCGEFLISSARDGVIKVWK